jgi:hypothetical protein
MCESEMSDINAARLCGMVSQRQPQAVFNLWAAQAGPAA